LGAGGEARFVGSKGALPFKSARGARGHKTRGGKATAGIKQKSSKMILCIIPGALRAPGIKPRARSARGIRPAAAEPPRELSPQFISSRP